MHRHGLPRSQTLGYAMTLAGDTHSTMDKVLNTEQIIRHHNRLLSWIVEKVAPASEIRFQATG